MKSKLEQTATGCEVQNSSIKYDYGGYNGVELLIKTKIVEANSSVTITFSKEFPYGPGNSRTGTWETDIRVNFIIPKDEAKANKTDKLKELVETSYSDIKNYNDLARWIIADSWYNDGKQLASLAETEEGRKEINEWVTEFNKHIKGGTVLDKEKSTEDELLSETNQMYTTREILKKLIATEGDKDKIKEILEEKGEIGEKVKKYIIKIKAKVTGNRKSSTFADILDNIDGYDKPNDLDTATSGKIETVASKILTAITNVGIVVAVLILAILGIKYMLGSVEEKAEYKKDLVPYIVGAFLLLGITTFVTILMQWGEQISTL